MLNVDERTAAQVAALLTIAATQNMEPMLSETQKAEEVGRVYEQMLRKVIQIYSRSG